MCFSACTVTNGGDAFSLTTVTAAGTNSAVGTTDAAGALAVCLYDFLLIIDGTDTTTGFVADRYCGNELNPAPAGAALSVPVCSKFDDDEPFNHFCYSLTLKIYHGSSDQTV